MPGGNTTTLACGTEMCSIPAQSCCIDQSGRGATCVTGTDCAGATPEDGGGAQGEGDAQGAGGDQVGGNEGESAALKCSGAANCGAGTICCVDQNGSSACAVSCKRDEAQLCDPAAGSSGCGDAGACSSMNIRDWGLPRTFGTCGGVGM